MWNKNDGWIVERNFEFFKRISEKDVIIDNEPVAHPVIHLSDIRANSALVLNLTNNATKRLRNAAYSGATQNLSETRESIERLMKDFNRFIIIRSNAEKRLMDSIIILESFIIKYEKLCAGIKSECELQKHKNVIANLTLRNEKVLDLLRAIQSVTALNLDIINITKVIDESSLFIETGFAEINSAYAL